MTENLLHIIFLTLAYLLLFSFTELLYRFFHVQAEITRKIVHVVTGLITLSFPLLLSDQWFVLIICATFFLLLLISPYFALFPSIFAVDRETKGDLMYPIVVYVCFLLYQYREDINYYYLPILILAVSDPLALAVGKKWPLGRYYIGEKSKTLAGSAAFFLSALIISLLFLLQMDSLSFAMALVISLTISLATTLAEALTFRGYDNFTIPVVATLVWYGFDQYLSAS
jgi:phytol kinase